MGNKQGMEKEQWVSTAATASERGMLLFFSLLFFGHFTSYILAYIRMYTRTRTKLLLLLLWISEEKEGEEGLCQQGRVLVYIYDVEFWECSRVLPTHGKNSLPRPSCRPR